MKMRLFKVYVGSEANDDSDSELCLASSHKQAAEITQTVWHENGFDCEAFQVVELRLPECVQEGKFVGLIYEPNTSGKTIKLGLTEAVQGKQ